MPDQFVRAAAFAAAAFFVAPAAAQNIKATDASEIMVAMQKAGFLVTRETADDGTPKLVSRVSDSEFQVYFYGCEKAGDPCDAIQFSAGYNLDTAMSAMKMNQWNSENRYVRGYIDDEGDPFVKFDLPFYADGIGPDNFEQSLDIWRAQIEDFEDFIGW